MQNFNVICNNYNYIINILFLGILNIILTIPFMVTKIKLVSEKFSLLTTDFLV